ncbi:hypothetical protein G6F31_019550 [Rhizopus arrhizus]|nr:hypothetical protein G6F31_019550 [Rhizopus arrhizus]
MRGHAGRRRARWRRPRQHQRDPGALPLARRSTPCVDAVVPAAGRLTGKPRITQMPASGRHYPSALRAGGRSRRAACASSSDGVAITRGRGSSLLVSNACSAAPAPPPSSSPRPKPISSWPEVSAM